MLVTMQNFTRLLDITRDKSRELPTHDDKKNSTTLSAEFLIGKLLSKQPWT